MYLPFEFECKIYPKPRGNWRPRVDLKIVIKKENYPWRPYLRGLCIVTECGECSKCDQRFALPQVNLEKKILPANGAYFIYLPSSPKDAVGGIFVFPERDNPKRPSLNWNHQCYTSNNNEKFKYSYCYLIKKQYLDEDITVNLSFYLPWLSEETPNYTDYAQRLAEIPALIEECLKDGLDSGESSEIIITRGQIVSNVLNNKNKTKQKIRKLNL